jgi:hypothetical protein
MARRLAALVFALGFAGASVASILCHVTCNVHSIHATSGHAHQHSHGSSPQLLGGTMHSATHSCDHLLDDSLAIQQALQSLTTPAVVSVQAFLWPSASDVTVVERSNVIDKSPPGLLALTAQLRV